MARKRSKLTAVIGAKTKGFRRAMGKVGDITKRVAKTIGKLSFGLGAIGGSYGLAIKKGMEYADTLRKQASMTGLAIKEQQKLNFLAGQFGVEEESMADAIKEVSMRMSEMAAGGAQIAAESVEALNTDAETLADLFNNDVGKALQFVSERMEGMSRGKQGMIVDQLFGGQGGEKIRRMLTNNTEALSNYIDKAEKMNFVSESSVDEIHTLNRAWETLKQRLKNLGLEFVASQANLVEEGVKNITNWIEKMRAKDAFIKGFSVAAKTLNNMVASTRKIWAAVSHVSRLLRTDWEGTFKAIRAFAQSIASHLRAALQSALGNEESAKEWRKTAEAQKKQAKQHLRAVEREAQKKDDVKSLDQQLKEIEKDREETAKKISDYAKDAKQAKEDERKETEKQNKELQKQLDKYDKIANKDLPKVDIGLDLDAEELGRQKIIEDAKEALEGGKGPAWDMDNIMDAPPKDPAKAAEWAKRQQQKQEKGGGRDIGREGFREKNARTLRERVSDVMAEKGEERVKKQLKGEGKFLGKGAGEIEQMRKEGWTRDQIRKAMKQARQLPGEGKEAKMEKNRVKHLQAIKQNTKSISEDIQTTLGMQD